MRDVLASGGIAGCPVVDVRVAVHDGKHHSVDRKDTAFATAGRKAFMAALRDARPTVFEPIVLEPIVHIEITAPDHAMGDITGDLASRRGIVNGTEDVTQTGMLGAMVVRGQAPLSELSGCQLRPNRLTSGQGRCTVAVSPLEPVPPAVQSQRVAQFKLRDDE